MTQWQHCCYYKKRSTITQLKKAFFLTGAGACVCACIPVLVDGRGAQRGRVGAGVTGCV